MSTRTRRLSVAVLLVAAISVLATSCNMNGDAWNSSQLVTNERKSRGIPAMALDDTLNAKAQAWADHMAATGVVSHSNLAQGAGTGWSVLGENVGWARSVDEMHAMFMNSASHRSALLSTRYTRFGVGVAVVNGRYYTAQVFAG